MNIQTAYSLYSANIEEMACAANHLANVDLDALDLAIAAILETPPPDGITRDLQKLGLDAITAQAQMMKTMHADFVAWANAKKAELVEAGYPAEGL